MKLFIWDLHGTLEQGNEMATLEISNYILKKHKYKEKFTKSLILSLYGRRWYRYFERLLPDESHDKHLELQQDCFIFSQSHPEIIKKHIRPSHQSIEVLQEVRKRHDQVLISNTQINSLKMYMRFVGISKFFQKGRAFAANQHKEDTKFVILKKYLENKTFKEIISIGDSPGDIEIGHSVGAKTFLYTHPGQKFKSCNPHYKINNLKEVLNYV